MNNLCSSGDDCSGHGVNLALSPNAVYLASVYIYIVHRRGFLEQGRIVPASATLAGMVMTARYAQTVAI